MSPFRSFRLPAVLIALALHVAASPARAEPSEFGRIVSIDENPNTLLSCVVGNRSGNGTLASPHRVMTRLRRYNSQGISQDDWKITHPYLWQRARLRCFSSAAMTDGEHAFGQVSTDEGGELSIATCPAHKPYGDYGECQLNVLFASESSYVYRGTACGDGIASIAIGDLDQLTGSPDSRFVDESGQQIATQWNDTLALGTVPLTDLGIPFFSAGRMHYAFGDTLGDGLVRNNVIARRPAGDFNPFAIRFSDFEGAIPSTVPGQPPYAPQLIPDLASLGDKNEYGPIPTGAWAISERGADGVSHEHRYIHFMAVKRWNGGAVAGSSNGRAGGPALDIHRSSLARSTDGGPWVRLDAAAPAADCSNTAGPWWCPSSNFTSVGAWHDTTSGYVYLAGIQVNKNLQYSDSKLKLMRVRATKAAIENKNEYEYWIGSNTPPAGCAATAPWCKGNESLAAPLKDSAGNDLQHVRELSISYNSYANRFVLMYLHAEFRTAYWLDSYLAMYQAPSLGGPWEPITKGGTESNPANPLPLIWTQYGPFLHDRNNWLQGRAMVHSLSENDSKTGLYNVGVRALWVTRDVKKGCDP